MHDVGAARRPPRGARVCDEERRQREREPRPRPEVLDDPVAERDPEVPEVRRRDDVDLDARGSEPLDRVRDEHARDVARRARIRRRQDADAHPRILPAVDEPLAHDLQAMAGATAYNAWLFDRARPWVRGRVLDVGAGIGTPLAPAPGRRRRGGRARARRGPRRDPPRARRRDRGRRRRRGRGRGAVRRDRLLQRPRAHRRRRRHAPTPPRAARAGRRAAPARARAPGPLRHARQQLRARAPLREARARREARPRPATTSRYCGT